MNIDTHDQPRQLRKSLSRHGVFYRCVPDWDFTDDFEVEDVSITDDGGTIKLFSGASAFPDIVARRQD